MFAIRQYRRMQIQDPAAHSDEVTPSTAASDSSNNELHNVPHESPAKANFKRSPDGQFDEAMIKSRDLNYRTQAPEDASSPFMVSFAASGSDTDPTKWSFRLRELATINVTLIAWITTVASSIDAAALVPATQEFGVSTTIESLATALFLIGLSFGVLTAGPISEEYGRNAVYIATMAVFMIFTVASALAPNLASQAVFRTVAGYFAATPLCCAGGSVADLWTHTERAWAFPAFAVIAFTGPICGPIIGGFIIESKTLSWRWCEWTTLIICAVILLSVLLSQPETHPPTLLRWYVKRLRYTTGDQRFLAEVDATRVTFEQRLRIALYRPFALLFNEPIIICLGLYLTVIYVVIFVFFQGYDYIFRDVYGFSQGLTGVAFTGTAVGIVLTALLIPHVYHRYKADLGSVVSKGEDQVPAERRLAFAIYGAPFLPLSIFWIGWTSSPDISCWSPLAGSVFLGYSTLCIYMSSYQYLIDAYGPLSASALASVTFVRYLASAGMYVAAIPIFDHLGVNWTSTILGIVSLLMTPVPYLLSRYGERIRSRSPTARQSSSRV